MLFMPIRVRIIREYELQNYERFREGDFNLRGREFQKFENERVRHPLKTQLEQKRNLLCQTTNRSEGDFPPVKESAISQRKREINLCIHFTSA